MKSPSYENELAEMAEQVLVITSGSHRLMVFGEKRPKQLHLEGT